jgi:hypothetical protein
MSVRLEKPWRPLEESEAASLPAQLGVYQIADATGEIVRIGYAGGKSRFGLRGEIGAHAAARRGENARFRCEINMQYMSRYQELLMVHLAEHGRLPRENTERADRVGRIGLG